jgi:hypothetical protein
MFSRGEKIAFSAKNKIVDVNVVVKMVVIRLEAVVLNGW